MENTLIQQQLSRGKFRSLTLINWNGFFARTFDLDQLVTTLSGGNGAGKSTTMAGFVAALIPDLTLLHFRNTTEAGASGGSRDKGLHGKLRPGVCYAVLEAENSRGERIFMGVRLQQVAGRDKKVDLKTFSLLNVPKNLQATALFIEQINDNQARVLTLNELAEKMEQLGVIFKIYHSVADYHAVMFDLGMLPKRLRSSGDRSKFYKLIEASLYGGISSAITRSLRDYLLPENQGVKKAFSDMESALRENRMTLEAIKMTQADRDLFKHLITESTQYVAADYMRHANERRGNIEEALKYRQTLLQNKEKQRLNQHQLVDFSREAAALADTESHLENDYQQAQDRLNLILNASRHQEKIERYQDDVFDLQEKVEEQLAVLEELREEEALEAENLEQLNARVEELRDELADYQQALDAQQTRALQYRQALQALERAKQECGLQHLTADNAEDFYQQFSEQLESFTEERLDLEQKLSLAQSAKNQFDAAYQLVCKMAGQIAREEAWDVAQEMINHFPSKKANAQLASSLRTKLQQLENQLAQQQQAQHLLNNYQQQTGNTLSLDDIETTHEALIAQIDELSEQLAETNEERLELRQQLQQLNQQQQQQTTLAPSWLVAQSALERLEEQSGENFETSQSLTQYMQSLLDKERLLSRQRDDLNYQRQQLDEQINRLSLPDGAEDPRLSQLAERFQGVLLSELYEDLPVEDAPYFSALYGSACQGIVVRDLKAIQNELKELNDCPDNLYFIEGDPNAFDDNVYEAMELTHGVAVQVSQRELRYSKFPQVPVFGKAAREKQIERLTLERDEIHEQYASLAFDVQKIQRLAESFSQFIGLHLALAFQPNPEEALQQIQQQKTDIERCLNNQQNLQNQWQQSLNLAKEQALWLSKLMPQVNLLQEEDLAEQCDICREELEYAQEDEYFVQQHRHNLEKLIPIANVLRADPANFERIQEEYNALQQRQKQLQHHHFLLAEVVERRSHFAFADAVITESNLNKQLRSQLDTLQSERENSKTRHRQKQAQVAQYNQVFIELNSALQEKNKMLQELKAEVSELGITLDDGAVERAENRKEQLHQQLTQQRQRRQFVEKQLILLESEIDNLTKTIRKAEKDYQSQRAVVVAAKASWCIVLQLSRQANMEKRLHRREYAYLSSEELRSMSDKALGALRTAVADNEYLRDSLRHSEDNRQAENKVRFFIAVYQHLRERIRQDIIKTDDPIDAIEQMEVELARLTEELIRREKTLSISAESVANIMQKTIQREQNRIRMLNQGLQNIAFGQVQSVRLMVDIRESHQSLLNALANNQDHQDLFNDNRISFSEAIAKLYQRLNPHLDMGQRSAQTVGEALLDYRNYLELEVEVFRGTDGWLKAESGALSTGEAIGTGMSILLMVVQSWEEESRRIRAKDILPCRLLFLDEAARLDAKSIATLFELCERLDMQLLIAAPENISPEKGTTYKLMRKINGNQEHVHVVGLRGFGARE